MDLELLATGKKLVRVMTYEGILYYRREEAIKLVYDNVEAV
jgi:hypothetical protein